MCAHVSKSGVGRLNGQADAPLERMVGSSGQGHRKRQQSSPAEHQTARGHHRQGESEVHRVSNCTSPWIGQCESSETCYNLPYFLRLEGEVPLPFLSMPMDIFRSILEGRSSSEGLSVSSASQGSRVSSLHTWGIERPEVQGNTPTIYKTWGPHLKILHSARQSSEIGQVCWSICWATIKSDQWLPSLHRWSTVKSLAGCSDTEVNKVCSAIWRTLLTELHEFPLACSSGQVASRSDQCEDVAWTESNGAKVKIEAETAFRKEDAFWMPVKDSKRGGSGERGTKPPHFPS